MAIMAELTIIVKFAKVFQKEVLALLWVPSEAFVLFAIFFLSHFRDMFEEGLVSEFAEAHNEVLARFI